MTTRTLAALVGGFGLAMVLGAVFFQFVVGVAPCEMCYWQRYPHAAAAAVGLIAALAWPKLGARAGLVAVLLALALVAVAGSIGVYHSGVEWRLLPGPTACTGDRVVLSAGMDLNAAPVVRCDVVQWRFLGLLSLANLNALFSLGVALLGGALLHWPVLGEKFVSIFRKG